MNSANRALAALFAAAVLATGCGGGAGGGDASPTATPAPAPAPAAPNSTAALAITSGNAAALAELAPSLGEAVLSVAQFAVDSTRRFSLGGVVSPTTLTCPNGGLLTLTLTDRDADGVASPGDSVTVVAHDCAVQVVTDIVNGTMQIDLGAPAGLPAGSLHAEVSSTDGLHFGTGGVSSLLGSMRLDWSSTDLQTALHVTASAADDLHVVIAAGNGTTVTESIRQPDLSKTLQFDQARSVVSIGFRYESQALAGSVTVSTPDPLRAYLDTYPEAGRIEVVGAAGSKVTLSPNYVNNSAQYQYALDSDGNGPTDSSGSVNWSDATTGYLWWDGTTALNGYTTQVFPTRSFATTDFSATGSLAWTTATTSTFRLQFSRPLAGTTPALYVQFAAQASPPDYMPGVTVAATATVSGALVVVKPSTPLRHGRNYALQVSPDGSNWYSGVTVQDALGNNSRNDAWTGLAFATPANLHASAIAPNGSLLSPTDQVTLDGSSSTGAPRPIVSYQWSQVSGTPLQFANAAAAQTTVSWGDAAPTGVEHAVLRLTVTDAAGDSDTTDLTILSADPAATVHALYYRSAPGDYVGQGATAYVDDSVMQVQQNMVNGYFSASASSSTDFWNLNLASADGTPLHVGAYENAIRAPFHGNQNGVELTVDGRGCVQVVGRFDVLDIQVDADGTIQRLAVDFEQHCDSTSMPALLGSYRYNSSVAIRR